MYHVSFPYKITSNQKKNILLLLIYSYICISSFLVNKLDSKQRARRQSGFYPLIYSIDKNKFHIPSYFRDYYQSFMNSLIQQYNIDEAILDYNLYRFSKCFQIVVNDYIRRHQYSPNDFLLNNKQKQYAFEFYLQIDGMHINFFL